MTRVWFSSELETVATFWRILRGDGVALGFTTHDKDLWFDGVLHAASPGMVPASIHKTGGFDDDGADVRGAITHDTIDSADLAAGLYDGAQVRIGLVDWETLEAEVLYAGTIGTVTEQDGSFTAALTSRKAELQRDPTPRTSPACRAAFCGAGCNLNPAQFTRDVALASLAPGTNAVTFTAALDPALYAGGTVRWLSGPQTGITMEIMGGDGAGGLVLGIPVDPATLPGTRALVRQGCDRTLGTCADRFANAVNFRGEPYLPGNDLLTRYPSPNA